MAASLTAVIGLTSSVSAEAPKPLPAEYLEEELEGVRFAYHPSVRDRVRPLIEDAAEVRAELSAKLGKTVLTGVEVRVAVNGVDLERVLTGHELRGRDSFVDAERSSVAFGLADDADRARSSVVFRSALAELAFQEATGGRAPRWMRFGFVGAYAEPSSIARSHASFRAALGGVRPRLADIDARLAREHRVGDFAEAVAVDLVEMLEQSKEAFHRLVADCAADTPIGDALSREFGFDESEFERALTARTRGRLVGVSLGVAALGSILAYVFGRFVRSWHIARVRGSRRAHRPQRPHRPNVRGVIVAMKRRPRRSRAPIKLVNPEVPKVAYDGDWHTLH